jgi:SAM-dependent methyltransferase
VARFPGRAVLGRLRRWVLRTPPASADYVVLDAAQAIETPLTAWHRAVVADRQLAAYRALIRAMRAGRPRVDLVVAAQAVRHTQLAHPGLLEVGCGGGYYSEILPYLLGAPIAYIGLDIAPAMVERARRHYPTRHFLVGDAAALPFADHSIDIVLNGVALMHTRAYARAIAESRRVSRRWCIFHTVPLLRTRPTTYLRKQAYGETTLEIIFNEDELLALFQQHGLHVQARFPSLPYDLAPVLGVPTWSETFLCAHDG